MIVDKSVELEQNNGSEHLYIHLYNAYHVPGTFLSTVHILPH